jgi:hypothetical protein
MFSLQSKLIALAGVAFLIAILVILILFYRGEAIQSAAQTVQEHAAFVGSQSQVQQAHQNISAIGHASADDQIDETEESILEEDINEPRTPVMLEGKDAEDAIAIARHFNCGGVLVVDPNCNKTGTSVLPVTGKTPTVSLQSVLREWERTVKYAHDLERTDRCYRESQIKAK